MKITVSLLALSALLMACSNENDRQSLEHIDKVQPVLTKQMPVSVPSHARPQASAGLALNGILEAWSPGPPVDLPEQIRQEQIASMEALQQKHARITEHRLDFIKRMKERSAGVTSQASEATTENSRTVTVITDPRVPDRRQGDKAGLRPGDSVSRVRG